MKCLLCEKWSWKVICTPCLDEIHLSPRIRTLRNGLNVYSFYRYEDVESLMRTKYQLIGSRILALLAKKAAQYFFSSFKGEECLEALALDDYPYNAYSHAGLILRAFARESGGFLKPLYGVLVAQNRVRYAGESLTFRQANPRRFVYTGSPSTLVLLDDIITTGTSFEEAIAVLHEASCQVVFCLALCDARS